MAGDGRDGLLVVRCQLGEREAFTEFHHVASRGATDGSAEVKQVIAQPIGERCIPNDR